MDKEKEIPDTIKNREPEEAPALAGESSERLPGREDLPRHIRENLKKLPDKPGVYLHRDKMGTSIYVGKPRAPVLSVQEEHGCEGARDGGAHRGL